MRTVSRRRPVDYCEQLDAGVQTQASPQRQSGPQPHVGLEHPACKVFAGVASVVIWFWSYMGQSFLG